MMRLDWTSPESVARWRETFGIVDQAKWEAEMDAKHAETSARIEAQAQIDSEAWLFADARDR
jgi:hypothetical protein